MYTLIHGLLFSYLCPASHVSVALLLVSAKAQASIFLQCEVGFYNCLSLMLL